MTPDTIAPIVTAVTDTGAGISADGSGVVGTGEKVTFSLTTSEPVSVTRGKPTLALDDGGVAAYAGGSGKNQLKFTYTAVAGQNTDALKVTGLSTNGASVTDKAGNGIDPGSVNSAAMPTGALAVDTTSPVVGLTSAGGVTSTSSVTLKGTVSGADAKTKVSVFDNGGTTAVGTAKVSSDGTFKLPAKLVEGTNVLSVVGTDAAGNASQPVSVTYIDSPSSLSVDQAVSYNAGAFTVSGDATAASGIQGVEVFAEVGGRRRDLGAATVNTDGTFSFSDVADAQPQTFIQAVATTGLGQKVTSGAHFDLTGSITGEPYVAVQDRYNIQTSAFAGQTFYAADGSVVYLDTYTDEQNGNSLYSYSGGTYFDGKPYHAFSDLTSDDGTVLIETKILNDDRDAVTIHAPDQTLSSAYFDTFDNGRQANSTFVFDPGHGLDVVNGFRLAGPRHDALSFKGSDFSSDPSSQLASVLAHASDAQGGVVIRDPTSHDAVKLTGVTRNELASNRRDVVFHP